MKTEFRKAIPAAEIRSLMAFDRKVFPPSDLFDADYWKACVVYWLIVDGVKIGCCAFEEHVDFQDDVGIGGINPPRKGSLYIASTGIHPKFQGKGFWHPHEILANLLRSPSRFQAHRNQHPQPATPPWSVSTGNSASHHPNHPSLLLRSQRRDGGDATFALNRTSRGVTFHDLWPAQQHRSVTFRARETPIALKGLRHQADMTTLLEATEARIRGA